MRIYSALVCVAFAGFTAACSGEAIQQTPAASGGRGNNSGRGAGGPAVPVTIATVVEKSVPLDLSAIGTVIAASTVAVRGQTTGELTGVNFKEGDEVQQGQVLFTLDRRPLEAALQQAQATLERDIAQAENAKAQAARYLDLLKRGIATREQVDQMVSQAAALTATVGADRAAVESAKVQLDYTTIEAPISGRTGLLQVHKGNLIRANDATQVIVTINRISPVYVSFAVPESMLPDFKHYMALGTIRVEAKAPSEAGTASIGKIDFIDNAVDATTGTIKVKGTFANEDRRLWPGAFVNVTVTLTTQAKAIVVPTTAIQTGQQGTYVYIVKTDQTVDIRPVVVARTHDDDSLIGTGLAVGDTVVLDGQLRLIPGSRISVKTAAKTAP